MRLCALSTLLILVAILWVLLSGSLGALQQTSGRTVVAFSAELPHLHAGASTGIGALLSGTLLTSGIAVVVALPLGLLSAIYLSEFSLPRLERLILPSLEFLSLLPTVVFAYFALLYCAPLLKGLLPGLGLHSALSAGLVMGILLTPLVAVRSVDALRLVPSSLREAACALGVGHLTTIFRIILPEAWLGILSAAMLAMVRAFGESMIVSIAAGHQPGLTLDPRDPVETMTGYILSQALHDGTLDRSGQAAICFVGLILFAFTFLMSWLGQRLAARARRAS